MAVAPSVSAADFKDRVRLAHGSESGEVSDMTPTEVSVGAGRTIAVNLIRSITFDGEPAELAQARLIAANGAYSKSLQLLAKIDKNQVRRDFIKQEIEYFEAYAAAKLALGGEGEVLDAGRKLNAFVRANPKNYHFLEATELMGELLLLSGHFTHAERQFGELAKTPWPEYKIRSTVGMGRSLQAQGKHTEAIGQFDAALATADDGPESQQQKLAATLGKAVSLAETGKLDEAVEMIEKIILEADPQQKELHARAYNALGTCYEKANKSKDALFAFLHVDVLYNTVPAAHAEALFHLVPLWKTVGQEERSRECRELLTQKYAASRWAKELK